MTKSLVLFAVIVSAVSASAKKAARKRLYIDTPFQQEEPQHSQEFGWERALGDDKDADSLADTFEGFVHLDRDLQMMSMSMSMTYAPIPVTAAPSFPPTASPSASPSVVPSSAPSEGPSVVPTWTPTQSVSPSVSKEPTVSSSPSRDPLSPTSAPTAAPSQSPIVEPSTSPTVAATVTPASTFECTSQGVALAGSTTGPTTPINLSITYAAEVNGTLTADVLSDLEATLLEAAIAAALGCNSTGRRALSGAADRRRKLAVTSESLGDCNATVADATCSILETDMSFALNMETDAEMATYKAYKALEDGMDDLSLAALVEKVVKLVYLTPLPLVEPVGQTLDATPQQLEDNLDKSGSRGRPWTIGATIAMSTGGLLVLAAFWRGRHLRRQDKHVELDDGSISPASCFSVEENEP